MTRASSTTKAVDMSITRNTTAFLRRPSRLKAAQKLCEMDRPMAYTKTARPSS